MSVPQELKVGPIKSVDTMSIETNVLDPITSSQSGCRFVLEKKGILDSGSMIQLSVHPTDALADGEAFLPIKTGIHGAIRRATLRIGSKVVAISDEYQSYATVRRAFKTCEEKAFKDMVKAGTVDVICPDDAQSGKLELRDVKKTPGGAVATSALAGGGTGYAAGAAVVRLSGGTGFGATATVDTVAAGVITAYTIVSGGSGYTDGDVLTFEAGNTDATLTVNTVSVADSRTLDAVKLTVSQTDTPVFSVKLSELFPAMRNVQLPLYLISEPCSIELTFNRQSDPDTGILCSFANGYAGATDAQIGLGNVKFIADYLTYSDSRMSEIARLTKTGDGLVIPYEDIVLTSTDFPALAVAPVAGTPQEQKFVRYLGLSGQSVRFIWMIQEATNPNALLGRRQSLAHHIADGFNLRVNDRLMFQSDVTEEAQKVVQLAMTSGTPPFISNPEYSYDITADKTGDQTPALEPFTADTFFGHPETALKGTQHYIGVDLTTSPGGEMGTGTRVGSKPIEWQHTLRRTNGDNLDRQVKFFSSVERVMSIKDGIVSVSA
jgi:hypothetical protein